MPKIVIVDDSEAVRMGLRASLESAGHEVIEAVDGSDGLDKILLAKNIDLVITDQNMPGLSGLEMIENVKKTLGEVQFPIFMLTTENQPHLKELGKKIGIRAWIHKSSSAEKILGAVAVVLRKDK